jgi:hypothetical protein
MGYILLLLFFLTWLNARKIRKYVGHIAKQYDYPELLSQRIIEIISGYHVERVEAKKLKKAAKKTYKEVMQDEKA